jgi:hypothetical protein
VKRLALDHLVVGAAVLEEGVAHVEQALGAVMQTGGKHTFMGTHNALLKLGATVYLEVIAIDPDAPPPRARWFNLDKLDLTRPRLIHWVVRTHEIGALARQFPFCGAVEHASRGALHWNITIPEDGSLPYEGAFPTLIEWPEGPHVCARMNDSGCALKSLTLSHPQAMGIERLLESEFSDHHVKFELAASASIVAQISTPGGLRDLS